MGGAGVMRVAAGVCRRGAAQGPATVSGPPFQPRMLPPRGSVLGPAGRSASLQALSCAAHRRAAPATQHLGFSACAETGDLFKEIQKIFWPVRLAQFSRPHLLTHLWGWKAVGAQRRPWLWLTASFSSWYLQGLEDQLRVARRQALLRDPAARSKTAATPDAEEAPPAEAAISPGSLGADGAGAFHNSLPFCHLQRRIPSCRHHQLAASRRRLPCPVLTGRTWY